MKVWNKVRKCGTKYESVEQSKKPEEVYLTLDEATSSQTHLCHEVHIYCSDIFVWNLFEFGVLEELEEN